MTALNEIEEALLQKIGKKDDYIMRQKKRSFNAGVKCALEAALTQLAALRETHVMVPREIIDVAMGSPELNPCNYDHDQVCELNSAMVEICTYFAAQTTEKPND